MKRAARLQAGRLWLPEYKGKRIVRGYARWFGVDLLGAIRELRMLGVELDAEYVRRIEAASAEKAAAAAVRRRTPAAPPDEQVAWLDEDLPSEAMSPMALDEMSEDDELPF